MSVDLCPASVQHVSGLFASFSATFGLLSDKKGCREPVSETILSVSACLKDFMCSLDIFSALIDVEKKYTMAQTLILPSAALGTVV